jgi:hypothetical protein
MRPRPATVTAVTAVAALLAGLGAASAIAPAADTDGMPPAVSQAGVTYRRAHLLTWQSPGDGPTVFLPVPRRPLLIRVTCAMPPLRASVARSAAGVEVLATGGGKPGSKAAAEKAAATTFDCPAVSAADRYLDPRWLPRDGDRIRLSLHARDATAGAASPSPPTSWTVAVYVTS